MARRQHRTDARDRRAAGRQADHAGAGRDGAADRDEASLDHAVRALEQAAALLADSLSGRVTARAEAVVAQTEAAVARTEAVVEQTEALVEQTEAAVRRRTEAVVLRGLRAAAGSLESVSTVLGAGQPKDRRAETRERLLASARAVFGERGYAGASVDDVARHAGFTKGAVYSHFASKRELFLAMVRDRFAEDYASLDGLLDGLDSADQLREVIAEKTATSADDPWVLLGMETQLFALRDAEGRAEIATLYAASMRRLAQHLDRVPAPGDGDGDDAGDEADPSDDAIRTAIGVVAVINTVGTFQAMGLPLADGATTAELVAAILERPAD